MRGDPVAIVIATDAAAAEQGASLVRVAYEVLPHTLEPVGDPEAETYAPEQLLAEHSFEMGDVAGALRSAGATVAAVYETAAQAHMGLEREAALAYIEQDDVLTVIGGSHEPHWSRGYLARILGLPEDADSRHHAADRRQLRRPPGRNAAGVDGVGRLLRAAPGAIGLFPPRGDGGGAKAPRVSDPDSDHRSQPRRE